MNHQLSTRQSSSSSNVRGGRLDQRPQAGKPSLLPTGHYAAPSANFPQRLLTQQAPSQHLNPQQTINNLFYGEFTPSFGLPEPSDIFGGSQGLSHPISQSTAENMPDQARIENGPQHLHAGGHDVMGQNVAPAGSHHSYSYSYSQPQDGLLPLFSPGPFGTASDAAEAVSSPRPDAPTSSRGQNKNRDLTEAEQRDTDESSRRIMKDYAGNNREARDVLLLFLQNRVAAIRASRGQPFVLSQGGKQKEYAVIIPLGPAGQKGGYAHWTCGLCQGDKVGSKNTFQKVAGHLLSKHFHQAYPKYNLWVCDQPNCNRGYSGLNELNRHMSTEHGFPMPGRGKTPTTPAASPSSHTSDSQNTSGPSAQRRKTTGQHRQLKPYDNPGERRLSHAEPDKQYASSQHVLSLPASQAPASSRPRHGSHYPGAGGNGYSAYGAQAVSQASLPQGYGVPMTSGSMYQLPMNQPGRAPPQMPTQTHFSPADMTTPLTPSPPMPMPNVGGNFNQHASWGSPSQYAQSSYGHFPQGGPQFGQ